MQVNVNSQNAQMQNFFFKPIFKNKKIKYQRFKKSEKKVIRAKKMQRLKEPKRQN